MSECPVCFEVKELIKFDNEECSHSFCESCLPKLKLCALCRARRNSNFCKVPCSKCGNIKQLMLTYDCCNLVLCYFCWVRVPRVMYDMCPDCNQLSDSDSSSESEQEEEFASPRTDSEEGEVEEECPEEDTREIILERRKQREEEEAERKTEDYLTNLRLRGIENLEEVHPPQPDEVCTSQFSNLSLESRQKVESILKQQKEREERRSRIAALKYLYDFTSSQLAELNRDEDKE